MICAAFALFVPVPLITEGKYFSKPLDRIILASLAYTGILNLIEMAGSYIPAFLYNNQELLITTATSAILYILASYYR
ncbi:hypothetical protein NC653_040893 [Populus alba x Populus x berolinensis]|uniref:Uncharacterized protein n=1 Tax=Populus alba x Populus x berolinensis TaxID=444605 RepID=A0AAD6L757_9ROSI|nr:hypothetical protein NC653_040893 [Populus alba x Populus x berolinensis]